MSRPWLILRVKQRMLARVEYNVRNQGAEYYSPRAMMRSFKTKLLRPAPLFPGYAFARPAGEQWVFLRGTFGVLDVLMSLGEEPARLPPVEITRLRAREGADGLVRLEAHEFKKGERVRVERGAVSLDAVVADSMAARDRVAVLMQVMGRWTRADVAVGDVSRE